MTMTMSTTTMMWVLLICMMSSALAILFFMSAKSKVSVSVDPPRLFTPQPLRRVQLPNVQSPFSSSNTWTTTTSIEVPLKPKTKTNKKSRNKKAVKRKIRK